MAGTQFTGGKFHGATEVKAHLRHNAKDTREQTKGHSNPHLNPDNTCYNYSILGLSYKEQCQKYDERIAAIDSNPENDYRTRRKTRVTMQSLIVYMPKDLPVTQQRAWFTDVAGVLTDKYGSENFIDADVHVDELHKYYNTKTNQTEMSRVHGHFNFVPEVNGRLSCKEFSSRSNIIDVNRQIDEMTMNKYGCKYMDGTGKHGKDLPVEELKTASVEALDTAITEKRNTLNSLDREIATQTYVREDLELKCEQLAHNYEEALKTANTDAASIINNAKAKSKIITSQAKREAEDIKKQAEKQAYEDARQQAERELTRILQTTTISDESLLQYTKTVKFADGSTAYDKYLATQRKNTRKRLDARAQALMDIADKDAGISLDDYSR